MTHFFRTHRVNNTQISFALISAAIIGSVACRRDSANRGVETFQGETSAEVFELLQGIWRGESRNPDDGVTASLSTILIDGDRASFITRDEETIEATFQIDATQDPKRITWSYAAIEEGITTHPRTEIFEVTDERLTICGSILGDAVPTEFRASDSNKQVIKVYSRKQ